MINATDYQTQKVKSSQPSFASRPTLLDQPFIKSEKSETRN